MRDDASLSNRPPPVPARWELPKRRENRRVVIVCDQGRFRAARENDELDGKPKDPLIGDGRYTVDMGYVDGRPAECFADGVKTGSHLEALTNDVAIAISLLLQVGFPVEDLRQRFSRHPDGGAASIMGAMLDVMEADAPFGAAEWDAGRETIAAMTPRCWRPKKPAGP